MNEVQSNNNSVTLQKVNLKNLDPRLTNVIVVEIIIGKQRPKVIETEGTERNVIRAVWNFTIRDALPHYINVTYCGSTEQIFQSNDKFKTGDVDPRLTNVIVVGIIIGKQRPKVIETEGTERNVTRAVWNFTIRDALPHYINVTYWGSTEQIFQANDKFKTGDVVEILNPQIIIRKLEDRFEQYHPMVTSPYKLSLNDRSAIVSHPDSEPYESLLRYPTKPTAMFVPIQDIHNSGGSISYADILGSVRGLGPIRTVTTKFHEMMQIRDIEVFDHTCPSLRVSLWEPDLINRSNSWKPRVTTLFMTDLKIDWSSYGHTYMAKATGRTIVTENPDTNEAKLLYEYAQSAPIETFDIVEQLVTSLPNCSSIDDIISVKQLQDRINTCVESKQTGNKSFTAILFGFVSHLDLDGLSQTLIVKCGRCKMVIKGIKCENSGCPVVFENESIDPEVSFDIRVMLSDHTGTTTNCRLSGHAAEAALNCSAREFASMSDDQKCHLKWKYLLERCKVRVAVIFMISQYPIISILQVQQADITEVSRKLPVY